MSVPAERPNADDAFEKAPHALLDQVRAKALTHADLYAYLVIRKLAYRQGGELNLSQERLAEELGCCKRSAGMHLTALLDAGWLSARKVGVGRICAYRPACPQQQRPSGKILPLGRPVAEGQSATSCVSIGNILPVEAQNFATLKVKTGVKTGEKTPELTAATQPAAPAPTTPLNLDGPPRPAPKPTPAPPPPDDLPVPPGMRRMRLRSTDGVTIREILVPISRPAASPPPPSPAPSPRPSGQQRYGRVIALLSEAGVAYSRNGRDAAAVRESDASPEEIVACYLALERREWGDAFQQRRRTIHAICQEYMTPWLNRDRGGDGAEKDYRETRYGRRIFTGQPGAPVSSDALWRGQDWRKDEL